MNIYIIWDTTVNGVPELHCRTLQELERLSIEDILENGITIKTRSSGKK
jgi:hypothetical protein